MNSDKLQRYIKIAQSTTYSEPEEGNFHTQLIPQMVEKYFPKDLDIASIILDIGCGQGTFMDVIAEKGYANRIGVTLSPEDAKACNEKRHTTVCADMSDLDIPADLIGMIWCRHALEHSPFPYFTLLEFNRVLKQGGRMYVEVPAPECPREHEFNPNHYSVLTPKMWFSLFKKSGFKVDSCEELGLELMDGDKKIPESNICFMLTKDGTPV